MAVQALVVWALAVWALAGPVWEGLAAAAPAWVAPAWAELAWAAPAAGAPALAALAAAALAAGALAAGVGLHRPAAEPRLVGIPSPSFGRGCRRRNHQFRASGWAQAGFPGESAGHQEVVVWAVGWQLFRDRLGLRAVALRRDRQCRAAGTPSCSSAVLPVAVLLAAVLLAAWLLAVWLPAVSRAAMQPAHQARRRRLDRRPSSRPSVRVVPASCSRSRPRIAARTNSCRPRSSRRRQAWCSRQA